MVNVSKYLVKLKWVSYMDILSLIVISQDFDNFNIRRNDMIYYWLNNIYKFFYKLYDKYRCCVKCQ